MELDLDRLSRPAAGPAGGFPQMPTIAAEAMVATSHPLATRAGVRALEAGGNAVDAALTAAAVLVVAEPPATGIGGDAFAQVFASGRLHCLNGSGRAPATLEGRLEPHGPRSVTVPGAVAAWADLAGRFGRLGLDRCLAPAVDLAERGLAATARIAALWRLAEREGRAPHRAPRAGERYRLPELAATLRRIAELGPAGFYEGEVAEAVAAATWLSVEDLRAHRSEWVEPLRLAYRGVEVCEPPPNGQGVAALLALGIAEGLDEAGLHEEVEAVKLALADARRWVGDTPLPPWLLEPDHLARRRGLVASDRALGAARAPVPEAGTTYLCCVDGEGTAVSFIQSLYEHFGSGVVAGDTGVVLQNRAAGFVEEPGHPNELAPGRRPFHTIVPGMLLEGGELLGPFGVMGGAMQAQGHFQVVRRLVDDGLDPQGALDAARFRVEDGARVLLEPGLWERAEELAALGHEPVRAREPHPFGVGQAILRLGAALVGGSDGRGDGHAAGL